VSTIGVTVFLIGVVAGVWLRARGFAIPPVYELAVWVIRKENGDFINRSGNGDNSEGVAALGGLAGLVVGALGVIVGMLLRKVFDQLVNHRS
jgi:hypothetical protein